MVDQSSSLQLPELTGDRKHSDSASQQQGVRHRLSGPIFKLSIHTIGSDFKKKRGLGRGTYLQLARKGIEEEREEDESSAIVKAGCIRLEIVKHAS